MGPPSGVASAASGVISAWAVGWMLLRLYQSRSPLEFEDEPPFHPEEEESITNH